MSTSLTQKELLDYAKVCLDRFVEVYKARLAVWSVIAVATTTLTGFGVQFKQPAMFMLASLGPMLVLLLDYLIKRHYAAPFLYVGIKLEYQVLGRDSAALLFAGSSLRHLSRIQEVLAGEDEEVRQRAFRQAYVSNGSWQKALVCGSATMLELLLAWYFP